MWVTETNTLAYYNARVSITEVKGFVVLALGIFGAYTLKLLTGVIISAT
jgi:hypothetical protein